MREPSPVSVGAPVWVADREDYGSELGVTTDRVEGGHDLLVVGHGWILKPKHRALVAPEAVIEHADLDSLAAAVRHPSRCCAEPDEVIAIAKGSPDQFDEYMYEADDVHLEVDERSITANVGMLLTGDRGSASEYQDLLEPAAAMHECRIESVRLLDEYGRDDTDLSTFEWLPAEERETYLARERLRPRSLEVRVAATGPSTVHALMAAARDVDALMRAVHGGSLDSRGVAALVRARRPQLLVGLEESEWFEAKGLAYPVRAPKVGFAAKIELAQDVARFANGEHSAVLVIGLVTSKSAASEVVRGVAPVKLEELSVKQYRDIIDAHVYPAVEGLLVERVALDADRGLLVIEIPAQPEEYKPFLVHGAVVGDRTEGAFISIVRRRGEGSIPVTASQIHATLAAGRALLRRAPSPMPEADGTD